MVEAVQQGMRARKTGSVLSLATALAVTVFTLTSGAWLISQLEFESATIRSDSLVTRTAYWLHEGATPAAIQFGGWICAALVAWLYCYRTDNRHRVQWVCIALGAVIICVQEAAMVWLICASPVRVCESPLRTHNVGFTGWTIYTVGSLLYAWLTNIAILCIAAHAVLDAIMRRAARLAAIARSELRCPQCGYSLVGLPPQRRCPECGHDRVEKSGPTASAT